MKEVFTIGPHELLTPYIQSYNLRRISVPQQSMFPSTKQFVINFYISGKQRFQDIKSGLISNCNSRPILVGHQNRHNWNIIFDSYCEMISVQFLPTGMHFLLGMNMAQTHNRIIELNDVLGNLAMEAAYKISYCQNTADFKFVLDNFFIKILAGRGIKQTSLNVYLNKFCKEPMSVEQLAKNMNLSTRQLNRRFLEVVGTTPKAYQRKERFTRLMNQSLNVEKIYWTGISYDYDFFDQAHLIKDFKHFTSLAPRKYFQVYKPILSITY